MVPQSRECLEELHGVKDPIQDYLFANVYFCICVFGYLCICGTLANVIFCAFDKCRREGLEALHGVKDPIQDFLSQCVFVYL